MISPVLPIQPIGVEIRDLRPIEASYRLASSAVAKQNAVSPELDRCVAVPAVRVILQSLDVDPGRDPRPAKWPH